MILSVDGARLLIENCMETVGHTAHEAKVISDHLIDCELRGLSFGGLPRALSVIERIQTAKTPSQPIRIVKDTPVSATINGGDQVGYLVAKMATDIAIEKAAKTGIAIVGAYETWYTGMFSYYLEMVTKAGFVGMIAGSGGQIVAPHGGTEPRFGTNPIAFGFPSEGTPVIWDIGTSGTMLGEVILKMRAGEPLPEGIAFDRAGQPTRDPAAALSGALSVWGGHKGSGLAMVVQLLGVMCGAAAAPNGLRDCGFFLLVINPDLLMPAEEYKKKVSEYAASLKMTRSLDADKPVRVPFERSDAERAKRLKANVIDVPDKIYEALVRVAEKRTG